MSVLIDLDTITFGYRDENPLFAGFSWQVLRGESWAVLGPSGCGKTTLLYMLAGIVQPTSGVLSIEGKALTRPRPQTGLILQDYGLLPWATIRQNAQLGLKIRGFYGPDGTHTPLDYACGEGCEPWLERLGLSNVADHYPGQVSGGQRQRTAIARTLALNPNLLLMDEPFSSLDAPTREGLQNLSLELQEEQGLTMILVTHGIEEAAVMGRKILLLGPAPNSVPRVIENPLPTVNGYRQSQAYLELCNELRRQLEKPLETP